MHFKATVAIVSCHCSACRTIIRIYFLYYMQRQSIIGNRITATRTFGIDTAIDKGGISNIRHTAIVTGNRSYLTFVCIVTTIRV